MESSCKALCLYVDKMILSPTISVSLMLTIFQKLRNGWWIGYATKEICAKRNVSIDKNDDREKNCKRNLANQKYS